MEFKPQEKTRLSKLLRREIAEQKAHELGVDPSDLMQRVFDGKTSWAKKTDIYVQLDKQRKIIAPKKVMRALRDGRYSIVLRIKNEIEKCRILHQNAIEQNHSASSKLIELKTSVEKINNQSQNLEKQITDIESKIESIKEREPAFKKAEAVLRQIRDARDQENLGAVNQLVSGNKELLAQYEVLRKNLHPHLEKARRCRQELQRVYWQIMKSRFHLQAISIQQCKKQIADWAAHLTVEAEKTDFMLKITDILKNEKNLHQAYQSLSSQTPPTHISVQEAGKLWDGILPDMENTIERQAEMHRRLGGLLQKDRPQSAESISKPRMRMAYSMHEKRR